MTMAVPREASSPPTAAGDPIDLVAPELARARRRRPAFVLVGLLLVALAALAGALTFGSLTSTTSVVVASRDLGPGDVVTAGDLRVVEIATFSGGATVAAGNQDLLIGAVARGPIPAGTILNPGLFVEVGSVVPEGMVVLGAALDRGASPGSSLRAGDRVDVLGVVPTSALGDSVGAEATILADGTIWSVEQPDAAIGGRLVVSLLVPVDRQASVAQAAADDRLRLSLTAGG